MAAVHFRPDFGSERVYLLSNNSETEESPGERSSGLKAFQYPFSNGMTYEKLVQAFNSGARINVVKFDNDAEEYESIVSAENKRRDKNGSQGINALTPLFLVEEDGGVAVFHEDNWPSPTVGSLVLMLEL